MFADFYRTHKHFVFVAIIWLLLGRFVSPLTQLAIILSLLLFISKDKVAFMLFGLFLLLYFSDSYLAQFSFAKPIKPYYLLGIGAAFFLGRNELRQGSTFYFVFLPFLTFAFLVIGKSEMPKFALQKTISYLLLVILVPNITLRLFKEYGPAIFKQFIVLITLFLLVAIVFRLAGISMVGLNRFHGFLGNPNAIGLNCTTFFVFFSCCKTVFPSAFFSPREPDYLCDYCL